MMTAKYKRRQYFIIPGLQLRFARFVVVFVFISCILPTIHADTKTINVRIIHYFSRDIFWPKEIDNGFRDELLRNELDKKDKQFYSNLNPFTFLKQMFKK